MKLNVLNEMSHPPWPRSSVSLSHSRHVSHTCPPTNTFLAETRRNIRLERRGGLTFPARPSCTAPTMQTFVLAVVLGVAAAATIPEQQSHLAAITSPASEAYQLGNASTSAPEEWTESETTHSQADNIQPTTTDPQSSFQNNRTPEYYEEPLTQSTHKAYTQAELQTADGDHSSQAVQPRDDAPQSSNALVAQGTPQVEVVQKEAVVSSQPPLSDSAQDASPSSTGTSKNTSASPSEPLSLPSGANFMLGIISTNFSCLNRPYGYYADPDIHCRVFHVCNPSLFSDGSVHTQQYSFMCGAGTVFDQGKMTCMAEWEAAPCTEASSFYVRNQEFGQVKEPRP